MYKRQNRYCPSYEEIAKGLDLASLATVHKHISILETKNYLKRGFNQSRSLEITAKSVSYTHLSRGLMRCWSMCRTFGRGWHYWVARDC